MKLLALFAAFAFSCAAQQFTLAIAPAVYSMTAGQSATFTVVFTGLAAGSTDAVQAGVSPKLGTLSITGDVMTYTAPAAVLAPETVTLTVIPTADKSYSATAVISLTVPVPALAAVYSFIDQAPGVAAPSLAIWAQVPYLPAGVGCSITYVGRTSNTGIYNGAASLSSFRPAVLLEPALSPGAQMVGWPQIQAICLSSEGANVLTQTVMAAPL